MDFESQFEKIAKDIQDREDREMALAFTNVVGSLLRENGVFVKTSRYEFETHNENHNEADKNKYIIKKEYGVSFDELDFTEHDKVFEDKITELEKRIRELDRIDSIRIDEKMELKRRIAELESKETVELPFDALETANMLINATYKAEIPFLEKQVDRNVYDIDDLEQIAEHLLVYCKHNQED